MKTATKSKNWVSKCASVAVDISKWNEIEFSKILKNSQKIKIRKTLTQSLAQTMSFSDVVKLISTSKSKCVRQANQATS